MKTELELLKMLRDYVDNPKTEINGLCGAADRIKGLLEVNDLVLLRHTLRKKSTRKIYFLL